MEASHLLQQLSNQWLGTTVMKDISWREKEPVSVRVVVIGQNKNQIAVVSKVNTHLQN